ncbi:hypothetical protein KC727_00890 [Candidatus Kaiserbacteria bacterium]|nr:hypothetical protein [Candidatus Kaiserbacteria bacterium]
MQMLKLPTYLASVALGFVAPLLILPVTTFTEHTLFFEEVVKLGMIYCIWRTLGVRGTKDLCVAAFLLGVAFGVSETLLLSQNLFLLGSGVVVLLRTLLTIPMHAATAIGMAFAFTRSRPLLGFVGALLLHGVFNALVLGWM